ncbi:MAG: putative manganese transporter [Bacillota bacterium]|nr:putative manganese transporter [Bacillota bacterium]
MADAFREALRDTANMVPWLLLIYVAIEFIEFKWGGALRSRIMQAGKAGPALGALFGAVPQCGFSVISSCLYAQRLITTGTLLAVYLSTSDEALPVILSQPARVGLVWPLLAVKVTLGLVAGYAVDLGQNLRAKAGTAREVSVTREPYRQASPVDADPFPEERGCCCHTVPPRQAALRELLWHPVKHTLRVLFFLLAVSTAINLLVAGVGEANLGRLFLRHTPLQPLLAGLVGLIPNCAASVAITQAYLKGALSFGSAIAGLSASAGLGTLVLVKENGDWKDTARVIGLLLGVSVGVGVVIQYLYG